MELTGISYILSEALHQHIMPILEKDRLRFLFVFSEEEIDFMQHIFLLSGVQDMTDFYLVGSYKKKRVIINQGKFDRLIKVFIEEEKANNLFQSQVSNLQFWLFLRDAGITEKLFDLLKIKVHIDKKDLPFPIHF